MKTVQTLSLVSAMSDVFRAFAGAPEAQCDMIANTVYTAAYHVMLANNKTQFNKLTEDAKMYGGDTPVHTKAIKATLGIEKVNAVVKHFRKTYFALSVALDQCGIPDMVAGVPEGKANAAAQFAMLDTPAQDYAAEFASVFFTTLNMPEKTEEERAAAAEKRAETKAAKAAEAAKEERDAEREARKALDAVITARVEAATQADVMARAVADMLATGSLPAELETLLIEAARTRETAVLIARASVASTEPETVTA